MRQSYIENRDKVILGNCIRRARTKISQHIAKKHITKYPLLQSHNAQFFRLTNPVSKFINYLKMQSHFTCYNKNGFIGFGLVNPNHYRGLDIIK